MVVAGLWPELSYLGRKVGEEDRKVGEDPPSFGEHLASAGSKISSGWPQMCT